MADLSKLQPGLQGRASRIVDESMLAPRIGSGSAPVFASPMMIALMEAACVECIERQLPPGHQSLGTHLDVSHSAPTPLGLAVTATAKLIAVDGRKLSFDVEARDEQEVIGKGIHTRVVVDTPRFEARLDMKRRQKPQGRA